MKHAGKKYPLIGATLACGLCLTISVRTQRPESRQNTVNTQQGEELPLGRRPSEPSKIVASGKPQGPLVPDSFSGAELISKLGKAVSPSMLEALQKSGDFSGLQATALESGGRTYVLGARSEGGLVLHLSRDHTLLAFGNASSVGETPSDEERHLLRDFGRAVPSYVTVLDEKLEAFDMQIQMYESKMAPKIHAVVYSKGGSRTVAFFDSTRVDVKKLLPASPESLDATMLKQLRSQLEIK